MNRPVFDLPIRAAIVAAALLLAGAVHARDVPTPPSADQAPIAILVDVTSGQVLFEREADRRFVPASMTKAMTLFTAFQRIEEGTLDPDQAITMPDAIWREWNGKGSTMWINAGDVVPAGDLLLGIANISANDASIMLAEAQAGSVEAWIAEMNAEARGLDMVNSHFGTPNGWPDEGATFTTARDLVKLGKALATQHPQKFARYIGKPGFAYGGIEQPNRDPLIGRLEGADGIKTGYTNEAGFGYLGTAQRRGQRLMLVVAGAPRNSARVQAARDLMNWGFSAFERQRVFGADDFVGEVRVQSGNARVVALKPDRDVYVNVPGGRIEDLSATILYDGPVRAPIAAGQGVATLIIEVQGMKPARIPLFAAESVEEAGLFDRIINALAGWLG